MYSKDNVVMALRRHALQNKPMFGLYLRAAAQGARPTFSDSKLVLEHSVHEWGCKELLQRQTYAVGAGAASGR